MRSAARGMARRAARRRRPPTLAAQRRAILQARVRLACGGVPTILTIGYEKLLPPELVAELQAAGVERVIDVRFRPQSRRPGMSKTRLGQLLGDHGIAYEHRRELGTPADMRWLFHAGRIAEAAAAYRAHVEEHAAARARRLGARARARARRPRCCASRPSPRAATAA